ncbi:MAG: MFS transporter [Anaerolineaceae bacterium]|nr:MFS transporter [Anaerolineaceae bacterium]
MIQSNTIDTPAQTETRSFQTSPILTIVAAHTIHDGYQGFLAPLLPLLIEKLMITKTQAGLLSTFSLLPTMIQPFLGWIADRKDMRWVVVLAPAVTGTAMSLVGVTPSYSLLALALIIGGFSSAVFHSVAPVMTGALSGAHLGRGMSFWMVGGELGRTLAPLVAVAAVGYLTLEGLPVLMTAGLLTSIIVYLRLRNVDYTPANHGHTIKLRAVFRKMLPVFIPLAFILASRSLIGMGLPLFLPTFLTERGSSLWFAGASLTLMQLAGVTGALLGGMISDRLGRRVVMVISIITTTTLFFLFTSSSGWVQIPLLLLLGFSSLSINPVIQAVVQENFSENRALANGFYMLFNFGMNAIGVALVGLIGEKADLHWAFNISAGVVLIGLPFVFMLPKEIKGEAARA